MAWHFNNLTTLTARRAIFNLSAFINPNDPHTHRPTRHVFFQGRNADGSGDGHIHEFWWDGNWHHSDLTDNTGAPLATDFPSSYMFKGSAQSMSYIKGSTKQATMAGSMNSGGTEIGTTTI